MRILLLMLMLPGVAFGYPGERPKVYPNEESSPSGPVSGDLDGGGVYGLDDFDRLVLTASGELKFGAQGEITQPGDGEWLFSNEAGTSTFCIKEGVGAVNRVGLYGGGCSALTSIYLGSFFSGPGTSYFTGAAAFGGDNNDSDWISANLSDLGGGFNNIAIDGRGNNAFHFYSHTSDGNFGTTSLLPNLRLHFWSATTTGASGEYGYAEHDTNDFVLGANVGSVKIDDGLILGNTTVNATTYSTTVDEVFIFVAHTATAAVAIDLSSVTVTAGRVLFIKDTGGNATTNNITITTEGAALIDGSANYSILVDDGSLDLVCDGTNWAIR